MRAGTGRLPARVTSNQPTSKLAFQKREDRLRSGIRLRESRERSLLKNLRLGQIRRFLGDIGIFDAGLRRREVRDLRLRQIGRVIQLVFTGADDTLRETQIGDGRRERRESGNGIARTGRRGGRALSPSPLLQPAPVAVRRRAKQISRPTGGVGGHM